VLPHSQLQKLAIYSRSHLVRHQVSFAKVTLGKKDSELQTRFIIVRAQPSNQKPRKNGSIYFMCNIPKAEQKKKEKTFILIVPHKYYRA
jgi:hypothetical protein